MVVRYNIIGFVDDSTCITGGNKNDMIEMLKEKICEVAQLWNGLLWVSGGKLKLPKYRYHLVHYNFKPSGIPKIRRIADDYVALKNDKDEDVQINSNNIFTRWKNLERFKTPDGNKKTQVNKVRKKAVKLTNDIVRCNCTQLESKMLYKSVWRKSVKYTLAQLFLESKEL